MMLTGIPEITDRTANTLYLRLTEYAVDIEGKDAAAVSLPDIRKCIGLSTNVSSFTDAKWRSRIKEMKKDRARSAAYAAREHA